MSINMIQNILNDCWNDYIYDPYPKDRRMDVLRKNNIEGMSTENIRFLINEVVRRFDSTHCIYLEVGTYLGCSFLSASLYNYHSSCFSIDNFSQFNDGGVNKKVLEENLKKFKDQCGGIRVFEDDYKELPKFLGDEDKINIYFYDGKHDYKNQVRGLNIILSYLSKKCIIFVDDINKKDVEKANKEFLSNHKEFESIKIYGRAGKNPRSYRKNNWWNGFEIMYRGF